MARTAIPGKKVQVSQHEGIVRATAKYSFLPTPQNARQTLRNPKAKFIHGETGQVPEKTLAFDAVLSELSKKLTTYNSTSSRMLQTACYACGSLIDRRKDAACKALGKVYHADCFLCDECDASLLGKTFYPYKGKILCPKDYQVAYERDAKRCVKCDKVILASILTVGEQHFHPECFTCIECRACLNGVRFIQQDERRYCLACYQSIFLPKCGTCEKPIIPPEGYDEARHIISDGKEYHLQCYRCQECNVLLDSKDDSSRCFPLRGRLYCFKCHFNAVRKT